MVIYSSPYNTLYHVRLLTTKNYSVCWRQEKVQSEEIKQAPESESYMTDIVIIRKGI